MLKKFVRIFGGDPNQKAIEEYTDLVDQINDLETQYEAFTDDALKARTNEFRQRLASGETLDDILVEAYATIREISKRTIGLRHYDVQMIGGIAMHLGTVTEMRTGEGKTLVATLPIYLNALELNPVWTDKAAVEWGDDPGNWQFTPIEGIPVGRGAHLITVNDYLARRDARWMAPIYNFLGLSVGVLQMAARTEHGKKAYLVDLEKSSPHEDQHQLEMVPRKLAYGADITYGTNNEYGFDYLRDNMTMSLADRVQRGHFFAIIDEVDNVLIDEARTPLIISGPAHDDTEWYIRMAQVVKGLKPEDYEVSERDRNITLTEVGETHVEQILGMALRDPERPEDVTPEQARLLGYLEQALRAEYIYKRNKEYIIQAGKVVIVDDFTGRLMPGRRWSDGLHQAVEAKEGVRVQSENVTYATITIQNYFRMYEKLSGMTGTAVTEAEEFSEIYSLEALAIPTNLEYLANREDAPLIALEERDEYGYKYTYYSYQDDSQQHPSFWKRKDYPDVIYRTEEAKLRAIVSEILTYHVIGRPILVGTTSVELSERVASRMKSDGVRRLAQTMLIRQSWFEENNRMEDGRQVAELASLNEPLDKLRPAEMRKMIRDMNLPITFNPEDQDNLPRLLKLLDLNENHRERLVNAMKMGIPAQVLNARKHTEESQIIASAGEFGAVTIATNMAGRGVDIKLGGDIAEEILTSVNRVLKRAGYADPYEMSIDERREAIQKIDSKAYGIYGSEINFFLKQMEEMEQVKKLGGLHVIGSERHEARRIDNQLRGRSSRQGDPGSSRFYLSLEDELMVRFGGQQMETVLSRMRVDDAIPIENALVSRIVEQSQTRVEGANFDVRKHLLEYDDVLNTQRGKIYAQRDRIFVKDDLSEDVADMLREEVTRRVPDALLDEEGPWKLLSWLEQIQPSAPLNDSYLPSYAMKLLRGELSESGNMSKTDAQKALENLASDALKAEEEHVLNAINHLIDIGEERLDEQLEERLETIDTFFEGLYLDDETSTRTPKAVAQELVELVRLPIKLSNNQVRQLLEDPDEVKDIVRSQTEKMMMGLAITRLIGAVERFLKESLGIKKIEVHDKDWDDLADQVLDATENVFQQRHDQFIGNGTPGHIVKDLGINIANIDGSEVQENDLYHLISVIPQGRKAAYDKKTHRRVWQRTTRLSMIYLAGKLLQGRESEEIMEDVLNHLESAQQSILDAWGESEFARLKAASPTELDDETQKVLEDRLGTEYFDQIQSAPLNEASRQDEISKILGRFALTKIYRELLLRVISELWVEYLTQMEALRVSIGLEAYGQRDPLVQYKNRAFAMFQDLLRDMRVSVVTRMFTFQPRNIAAVQTGVSKAVPAPQESAPAPAGEQKSPQQTKSKRRRRRKKK